MNFPWARPILNTSSITLPTGRIARLECKQYAQTWVWPVAIIVMAITLRGLILASGTVTFDGDEAVVALMAKHILAGERPVFFYGQGYLGSLDSYLIAFAFGLLGPSVAAARFVQIGVYAAFIATTYLLARRYLRDELAARIAAAAVAFPPVLLTLYTTVAFGGYGETLVLGNLLLLWGHRLGYEDRDSSGRWLVFGLLAGLAFWTFGLILVYLVPLAVFLLIRGAWRNRRGMLLAGWGFVVGSGPWWLHLWIDSGAVLNPLVGGRYLDRSVPMAREVWLRAVHLLFFSPPSLTGLKPPWATVVILPLLGLPAQIVWLRAAVSAASRLRRVADLLDAGWLLLWGVGVTLVAAFMLTPYGADPSGRYFLPLYVPMALALGALIVHMRAVRPRLAAIALAVVLGYNVAGNAWAVSHYPPGLTTQFSATTRLEPGHEQELIDFLLAHGGERGYSNYWATFPIAFLSDERIIFSPQLPYQPDLSYASRDDCYSPYTQAVAASPTAVYVTTNHPHLDALIRERLSALGVTFAERQIGSYHVFYDLSRKVPPDELTLD